MSDYSTPLLTSPPSQPTRTILVYFSPLGTFFARSGEIVPYSVLPSTVEICQLYHGALDSAAGKSSSPRYSSTAPAAATAGSGSTSGSQSSPAAVPRESWNPSGTTKKATTSNAVLLNRIKRELSRASIITTFPVQSTHKSREQAASFFFHVLDVASVVFISDAVAAAYATCPLRSCCVLHWSSGALSVSVVEEGATAHYVASSSAGSGALAEEVISPRGSVTNPPSSGPECSKLVGILGYEAVQQTFGDSAVPVAEGKTQKDPQLHRLLARARDHIESDSKLRSSLAVTNHANVLSSGFAGEGGSTRSLPPMQLILCGTALASATLCQSLYYSVHSYFSRSAVRDGGLSTTANSSKRKRADSLKKEKKNKKTAASSGKSTGSDSSGSSSESSDDDEDDDSESGSGSSESETVLKPRRVMFSIVDRFPLCEPWMVELVGLSVVSQLPPQELHRARIEKREVEERGLSCIHWKTIC